MFGKLSDIDIRLLRVFVAVVESGGFSLATARLNVAESTVSQHMSDLETRIGFRLCERGRSGFKLTNDGEKVYNYTLDLLSELEKFRDQVSSVKSELAGTLRVGAPDGMISESELNVGAAIAGFMEALPQIKLEVIIRSPRNLEKAVFEGEIDLAIGAEHRRVSGLSFQPLFTERNSLFCGRSNALFDVADSDIKAADLETVKRIARGYLDRFDEQFFKDATYCATVHQIEAAAMLILNSTAIGFLPDHFAKSFVEQGKLRMLRPDVYSFSSHIGLITRPDRRDDPRLTSFVNYLVEWPSQPSR